MTSESSLLAIKVRGGLWHLSTLCWIFAITDRSFAFFADAALSASESVQFVLMLSLCLTWSYLKPANLDADNSIAENISTLKYYKIDSGAPQHEDYRHKAEARMLQLEKYHLINQEYVLPFPYLCQVYHLLNVKHLESVHSFSLNNLKVTDVSQFEPTESGGVIKFQTVLSSSINALKVWRQSTVEAELTLHTPYMIELNIPAYSGKRIAIIFNILPLSNQDHKLFIDIYSNLILPRPILQGLLHFASGLTLLEDLPYLHRLAKSNIQHSGKIGKSKHKMLQLFNRFVELYGSSLQEPPSIGAIKLQPLSGSSS
jgi:hypothetical protein